jgi:hypothetical protein
MKPLYSRAMNEAFFTDLSTWLTQAGLAGTPEPDIVSGCCDRCVAARLPLGRTQVFIDTLHPVHEGRLFRWGFGRGEPSLLDYGRTSPDALAASGSDPWTPRQPNAGGAAHSTECCRQASLSSAAA